MLRFAIGRGTRKSRGARFCRVCGSILEMGLRKWPVSLIVVGGLGWSIFTIVVTSIRHNWYFGESCVPELTK
jgi:hypothetical protein